jgi:hypothetical protein
MTPPVKASENRKNVYKSPINTAKEPLAKANDVYFRNAIVRTELGVAILAGVDMYAGWSSALSLSVKPTLSE